MAGAAETPRPTDTRVRNPYVGPRAFEASESEFFFGRDQEIEILAGLVLARRAALLFAPSGAGKSSLLLAGVIPELARQETVGRGQRARTDEKMRVLPVLTVGGVVPEGMQRPIANVYVFRALLSLLPETDPEDLADQTLADALAPFFPPAEPDPAQLAQFPTSHLSTLLVFDQFEELFTWDPTRHQEREGFFRQVNQALGAYPTLHVLFSMREDYIAELTPYAALLPEQLRPRFRLEFLGKEAAHLAIQQPARQADVEFADAAAAKLVDDLRRVRVQRLDGTMEEQVGAYVEPVQLQVVCRRLWDKLLSGATQIIEADIEAAGDVDSALAGYYAERVAHIAAETSVPERTIREWVDRQLITEQGIRGQVLQGPDQSQGLDNGAIWPLVDAHLVRAEKRRGATWFELAHDRLIEPVRADNAAWREANLIPLQRQAALWEEQGRPEGLLLHGPALKAAAAWAAAHQDELADLEEEFIDDSVKTGRLRSAKRLRFLLLGAAVVVVLLSALAIFAWSQAEEAQRQKATAVVAEHEANVARDTAVAAEDTASAAEDTAVVDQVKAIIARDVAMAAQQTSEADRQAAVTARAQAESGLISYATDLAVSQGRAGTIQALEMTNQALAARLTPTPSVTPRPTETPMLPPGSPRPSPSPTRIAPPTITPTPTPNQQATAAVEAATAQAIQTQLAQVRATQTAVASCTSAPQGEFSAIWKADEMRSRLGCPKQPSPTPGYWAEQPFQNGYMYWSQSPDLYIATIGNDIGTWTLFHTEETTWPWNPEGVSCPADPPPGLQQPVRGFGGLWCANPRIRSEIGFATQNEQGVDGNLLQEFERGFIFQDSRGSLHILFDDNGTYVRDMVFISGGQLVIGSPADQGEPNEHPQSSVTVAALWLDRFEVTNAEYRECVAARVCAPPHREDGTWQVNSATRQNYYTDPRFDRFPVIFVSWSDAHTYCQWSGQRLPTEAEWEWAAKGPEGYTYPWGPQPATPTLANYNGNVGDTRKVGMYDPSAPGLYDMAGNVWEWTSSLYVPYPYLPADGRENPTAAGERVLRGGSWRDGENNLRTANRNPRSPDRPFDNIGFRCARSTE